MPTAVIDLTEMVRLAMQRPEQSSLFQAWEKRVFTWVTSEQMLTEFIEVLFRTTGLYPIPSRLKNCTNDKLFPLNQSP